MNSARLSVMSATDATDNTECPTCGRDDFKNERGLKLHHAKTHGESLATETFACEYCGNEFERKPYHVDRYENLFCGLECRSAHFSETRQGEGHPNYQQREVVECAHCGDELERPSWQIERTERQFCDQGCMSSWRSEMRSGEDSPHYNRSPVECWVCGETFKVERHVAEGDRDHVCSPDCRAEYISRTMGGEDSPHWKGGEAPYGPGWTVRKKRRVRIRDQARCQECGATEPEHLVEFGTKHDVHHVTPARECDSPEERNAMNNLVTLCHGACHEKWNQRPGERPPDN
jgi:hypothetical protein